ncbi:hypothetical protein AEA09_11385 [Lysinibacillus contaminans]|uniref:DUF4358 domain-containing protein n=1 Tax=Lysinibacillus contaminans TaxID=1293441 RepID=A0ABR5K2K8_9BACI|nr:DUF4358 domain-containing protein [Lysinibacillus contaminans]KOS69086.1 hypothetical protein AEA09_11385 [Lysinibacillus contaminans]
MKKMMLIMLTMVLAMVVSACSGDKTTTIEASKSAKEMADQMLKEVEQPDLMELSEEEMQNLYNIDPAKLEDFSVRVPMMNVKTNEIAIFKVKDEKDVADVEAAAKQRAENVMKQFEQYLPDQYENAKNHKIVVKGNYVLLVISDRADELIKVYDSFFEEK